VSVEIRVATEEDWRRVRDLRLRALEDSPDAFGSTLEAERAHAEVDWLGWICGWEGTENRCAIAVAGGDWVGMAVGSQARIERHAHLYAMWVDPRFRRSGLGGGLVDAVVAWAAARGATALELDVTETNDDALAFYGRCGFADTGRRHPLREGSSLSVIVMRRPLMGA
jgi:ribosomal protein S18 acetylase RimI-like enzyme